MKQIATALKGSRNLVFLDLEGTQFSHEMIALGAFKATIGKDLTIKKHDKGFKIYVRAKEKIGQIVIDMTGITPSLLRKEGVSYKEALEKFKKYLGRSFSKSVFITFGSHDIRIVNQSLLHSPDADKETVKFITKHHCDLGTLIGGLVRDEKNNPMSLTNYCKFFNVSFEGTAHDPLFDAKNLMYLYDAFLKQPNLVSQEYEKVLNSTSLPEPVRKVIKEIEKGNTVDINTYKKFIKESLK